MQNIERIAFVLLISAILIVLMVTLLMLLSMGMDVRSVGAGAMLVCGQGGGV